MTKKIEDLFSEYGVISYMNNGISNTRFNTPRLQSYDDWENWFDTIVSDYSRCVSDIKYYTLRGSKIISSIQESYDTCSIHPCTVIIKLINNDELTFDRETLMNKVTGGKGEVQLND